MGMKIVSHIHFTYYASILHITHPFHTLCIHLSITCPFLPGNFLQVYQKAQKTPKEKYPLPQTEAQEIGWDVTPLVSKCV